MATVKRRVEYLEEQESRRELDRLFCYLEGRTVEDVEFFCLHGYVPDVPLPGVPWVPPAISWAERWKQWKAIAGRSIADMEFFASHGSWPDAKRE